MRIAFLAAMAAATSAAIFAAGCSSAGGSNDERDGKGGEGNSGAGGTNQNFGGASFGGNTFKPPSADLFPAEPIRDPDVTDADIASLGEPGQFSPGLCVVEPQLSTANSPGALFPKNWLRPRFRWQGSGNETVWEIRMTAPGQTNALVAYTKKSQWLMPKELWTTIADGVYDNITVTIRGKGPSGVTGSQGDFRIAPVLAGGAMVFWGTSSSKVTPDSSQLYGFSVGDEAVVATLKAGQAKMSGILDETGRNYRGEKPDPEKPGFEVGAVQCVGCHTSTPDGKAVGFLDDYGWNSVFASVEPATAGDVPAYVSAGAQSLLKMPFWGTQTMNANHWSDTERTVVATFGRRLLETIYVTYADKNHNPPEEQDLVWLDLATPVSLPVVVPAGAVDSGERENARLEREEALLAAKGTAWGVIATGETLSISNPDWSNDGATIAYSVSEYSKDGHPDWHSDVSDIHTVEYNDRAGGTGTALAGASDPDALEYYPAFSSDDALIAFTRAPKPSNTARCREDRDPKTTEVCANDPATLGENPDGPYYNRKGEIYIVPRAGADQPIRLVANDPVACTGETSPGVLNSWPKWSSQVREDGGKKYYFLIFSSARAYPDQFEIPGTLYTPPIQKKSSQLYMAPIEVAADGTVTTYPAIYLWNQTTLATGENQTQKLETSNLTPAWEDFTIPPVPPVIVE